MSGARNGNRKCAKCGHFMAAHNYRPSTDTKTMHVDCAVPGCACSGKPTPHVPKLRHVIPSPEVSR